METFWSNDGNSYSAFVSDVEANRRSTYIQCPCCACKVSEIFVKHQDCEGDITHWTYDCTCGAQLTLFND